MIQELNDMETQGVISRLQQPTSWVAGIVVANKKNGGVRKPLSCCVLRETPSKMAWHLDFMITMEISQSCK